MSVWFLDNVGFGMDFGMEIPLNSICCFVKKVLRQNDEIDVGLNLAKTELPGWKGFVKSIARRFCVFVGKY